MVSLMVLYASVTAVPTVDLTTLYWFSTEKSVPTSMGSQKRACWCWLDSASSTQAPVWGRSFGCSPGGSYIVNLFQVVGFRIFTRWRGKVLGQGQDDIIILIGADSIAWETV